MPAVVAEVRGRERRLAVSEILVATGRRPVLDGLGLERAGVEVDERGRLVLDDELRTTNPRIFAAGDVMGAPQFVYVAAAQGTVSDLADTWARYLTMAEAVKLTAQTFTADVNRLSCCAA